MSKIALSGNVSGTGVLTLAAPNTNTDRTFNLPDASGTVLTDVSDIEAQVKTATNASGSAPVYACRAWVNFDGKTGSGNTIRGSGNVSSVTKNSGDGHYTVNFTTAMPDVNFSVSGICVQDGGSAFNEFGGGQMIYEWANNPTRVTTSVQFYTWVGGTGRRDAGNISIQVFR
jgi:hypothetical protein